MSKPTKQVTWRLPVRVASDMGCVPGQRGHAGGDWSWFRAVLMDWAENPEPLDAEVPEETAVYTMRMPPEVLKALDREAARLSKATGRKWTRARVAREVWDRACEKGLADALEPEEE